jgi:hypothetical protein
MYGVIVKASDGWQMNDKEVLIGLLSYNEANDYVLEMNNKLDLEDDKPENDDWVTYYEVIKLTQYNGKN